jgi:lipopolysaccharide export LptBFGC system permease protein LptF
MSETEVNQDDRMLDALIVQALEARPHEGIPADFAARVVRQLPVRKHATFKPRRYGLAFSWMSAIALIVSLFFLAPSITRSSQTGEWIGLFVCAQFLFLVVWMTLRAHRTNRI